MDITIKIVLSDKDKENLRDLFFAPTRDEDSFDDIYQYFCEKMGEMYHMGVRIGRKIERQCLSLTPADIEEMFNER